MSIHCIVITAFLCEGTTIFIIKRWGNKENPTKQRRESGGRTGEGKEPLPRLSWVRHSCEPPLSGRNPPGLSRAVCLSPIISYSFPCLHVAISLFVSLERMAAEEERHREVAETVTNAVTFRSLLRTNFVTVPRHVRFRKGGACPGSAVLSQNMLWKGLWLK